MSTDRSALLSERVLFRKLGEGLDISDGTLEVYNDSVVLKPRWRGQFEDAKFDRGVRRERMTSGEDIPFSNIIEITGVVKGRLFKTAEIRLRTEPDVTWEIRASPKIYSTLLDTFRIWKSKASQ